MSDVSSEPGGGPGSWTASEPTLPETGDTGSAEFYLCTARGEKSCRFYLWANPREPSRTSPEITGWEGATSQTHHSEPRYYRSDGNVSLVQRAGNAVSTLLPLD